MAPDDEANLLFFDRLGRIKNMFETAFWRSYLSGASEQGSNSRNKHQTRNGFHGISSPSIFKE